MPLELEEGDLPLNTFSPKKPFKGKVVSVETLTGPKATGETCNIVIETRGEIPYWEGQSYGVVPPVRVWCRACELQSNIVWRQWLRVQRLRSAFRLCWRASRLVLTSAALKPA